LRAAGARVDRGREGARGVDVGAQYRQGHAGGAHDRRQRQFIAVDVAERERPNEAERVLEPGLPVATDPERTLSPGGPESTARLVLAGPLGLGLTQDRLARATIA
jgi:hypothetical protein